MATDPKDNKGGDLAEIRDLQGRKVPKPTVTQRRNKWTKEADTQALARQAREDVDKTRLVTHSRQLFQEKAANSTPAPWAKEGPGGRDYEQERATSRLTEPDLPKRKATAKLSERAAEVRNNRHAFGPGLPFRAGDPNRAKADQTRLAHDRKAANAWASQEQADIESGAKKVPLTSREKEMADKKYSDLAPSKRLSSNLPAAAQSRMDANKPLKTALVRDLAPGVSRDRTAANLRADRTSGVDKQLSLGDKHQRKFMSLMNAAETGEAQQFVGKLKPGVAARTEAHSIESWAKRAEDHQDRQMSYPTKPGDTWGHTKTYVKDEAPTTKGSYAKQPAIRQVTRSPESQARIEGIVGSASSSMPGKDLGEAAPGASKAQGLRARAVARSVLDKRSESPKAAVRAARTEKAFNALTSSTNQSTEPKQKAFDLTEGGIASSSERASMAQSKAPIGAGRKDLGRAVVNTIRREPAGGSLEKLARARAAEGRSVAGPDAKKPRWNAKRDSVRSNVATGSSPRLTGVLDDSHDLTSIPGWSRKIRPGDL